MRAIDRRIGVFLILCTSASFWRSLKRGSSSCKRLEEVLSPIESVQPKLHLLRSTSWQNSKPSRVKVWCLTFTWLTYQLAMRIFDFTTTTIVINQWWPMGNQSDLRAVTLWALQLIGYSAQINSQILNISSNRVETSVLSQLSPMQLTCRALESGPIVDAANRFQLGHRHYLTRPSGSRRNPVNLYGARKNDQFSLATCFRAQKNQTINADCLRAWPSNYLDEDDVFHPAFLQEIIFAGTDHVCTSGKRHRMFLKLGRHWKSVPHLTLASRTALAVWTKISFIPFGGSTKIVSLLSYKLPGPRLKMRGRESCPALTRWIANAESSAYVEINAARNGYRGHGIAVPSRFSAQDFGSPTPFDHKNSNR